MSNRTYYIRTDTATLYVSHDGAVARTSRKTTPMPVAKLEELVAIAKELGFDAGVINTEKSQDHD